MRISLLTVLLVLSVIFGIQAVWTSRLQISARKQIVGPLARKLGWWMIAMPLVAAVSVVACVAALMLMNMNQELACGQGIIFGIVIVLLSVAYTANAVRKYGVPITKEKAPLDWTNVAVRSSTPDFAFLENDSMDASDTETVTEPMKD
jgi:hypothetical protein